MLFRSGDLPARYRAVAVKAWNGVKSRIDVDADGTAHIRGTVVGPWLTTELIDTVDGTSSGQVVLLPRPPWGTSEQNFTVWMPEYPH